MNTIKGILGKVGSFFSGLGTVAVKDYKGATKVASNDINIVEKDVKYILWVVLIIFIIQLFVKR